MSTCWDGRTSVLLAGVKVSVTDVEVEDVSDNWLGMLLHAAVYEPQALLTPRASDTESLNVKTLVPTVRVLITVSTPGWVTKVVADSHGSVMYSSNVKLTLAAVFVTPETSIVYWLPARDISVE